LNGRSLLLAGFVGLLALANCRGSDKRSTGAASSASASVSATAVLGKPRFVPWKRDGLTLEQFVQREIEGADAEHTHVMVYVGATWCEPCQHFHEAVGRGELDAELAGTRFLEFDADRDRAELRTAGYVSKYIPLFAIPEADGRASGRMIEGSIKGNEAVRKNLLPRLRALLEGRVTE
jgi:thiol:disulfide interchange protein